MIDPVKLREAREAAGLNRSQLSKAAGLSRNVAHRLEDGSRGKAVQATTLAAIAEALGVEPESLLYDGTEDPPPPTPRVTAPTNDTATVEPEPDPEAWRWG